MTTNITEPGCDESFLTKMRSQRHLKVSESSSEDLIMFVFIVFVMHFFKFPGCELNFLLKDIKEINVTLNNL